MAARKTRRSRKKAYTKRHPNWRERGSGGQFAKQGLLGSEHMPIGPESLALTGPTDTVEELDRMAAEAPFVEMGATGLRQYHGILDEEFLPALRGRRARQVYTEMKENDPTVGAVLFAVEMLMRQVDWRVEPGSDDPVDLELAEFIDGARDDMSETWPDTLASIFSFLPFGFSIHEEVYKRRDGHHPADPTRNSKFSDGRIGWRKLPVRAQDTVWRWIFNPLSNEVAGVVQQPPPDFRLRTIPAAKFMLFRTTAAKGSPEGRSILRSAYRPWYFKRRIEEIEGVGIERDLAGLPTMQVPAELLAADASPAKKAILAEIRKTVRDVRRDEREGLIIPREFDAGGNPRYVFELLRSGGRRQFDTTSIVNRYDRLIAGVVLADFILLGQQRVGAFSLAESKTEIFGMALGAWLDSVTAQFNRVGIPRLLALNGVQTDTPPKLVHGDVESVDLEELGKYISDLTGAGMPLFPDTAVENVLRMQGGLPEKTPGEEGDGEPEPGDPPPPPPAGGLGDPEGA